jgi:integrase/recombinase XerC
MSHHRKSRSDFHDLRNNACLVGEGVFFENGSEASLAGFDPYFAGWIQSLRSAKKSRRTEGAYAIGLSKAVNVLSEIAKQPVTVDSFSRINSDRLQLMKEYMRRNENASDRTIGVRYAAIRSFAKYIHTVGDIPCDDILIANWDAQDEVSAHCPSVEDCKELIEAKEFDPEQGKWEDLRDLALLHLILADAFVLHECVGLNRSDLNQTLTCAVVGRTGGLRRVDLDSFTSAVFAEYISVCPFTIEGEAPVFVGTMGARLLARTAQLSIEKLRNRLALHEKASARSLRRAAIVRMRAEGTPDAEILRITGLKSTAHLADSIAEMPTDYRVVEEAITQARQKLAPRRTVVTAVSLTDSERRYTKPDCLNRTSLIARTTSDSIKVKLDDDPHISQFIEKLTSSKDNYATAIRHFSAFLRACGKQIANATSQDIVKFEAQRAVNCTQSTISLGRTAISQFYKFLYQRGVVPRVPTLVLPPLPKFKKAPAAAQAAAVQQWIGAVEGYIKEASGRQLRTAERIAALVAVLGLEGLKLHEALDLPSGVAAISRLRPTFCEYTIAALRRVEQGNRAGASFMFYGHDQSCRVTRQHARRWLTTMANELGLPRLPPEAFTQAFRRAYLSVHKDVHALAKVIGRHSGRSLTYQFRDR